MDRLISNRMNRLVVDSSLPMIRNLFALSTYTSLAMAEVIVAFP